MVRVIDTARNSRLLLAALVLVHVVAISHQVDAGNGMSLLERAVFAVLSPAQRLVSAAVRGLGEAWRGYVDLRDVRQENRRLQEQVAYLETLLQQRQHQAREAERLRELLRLAEILPLETVAAEVVARDGLPWFRTLTLDRGTADGVTLNAPVLSPTGVVGRVVAVGPRAAKVQTLLDRDSGVGVAVERSRVMGVVVGQVGFADAGTTELMMKYVSSAADIVSGDVIVTSGLDGIFPKGLMVGRVSAVGAASGLFKDVHVAPSARLGQIEEVLVVKGVRETPVLSQAVR